MLWYIEVIEATKEVVESKVKEKVYLDYKISRKGDRFECISLQAIKDVTYGKVMDFINWLLKICEKIVLKEC